MSSKRSLPFYISYGEEDLFLDRDLARARQFPGREVTVLDGAGLTDHDLVSCLETMTIDYGDPTASSLRAVVVDDAQKIKGDKVLKKYIQDKVSEDDSVVLVVAIRSEKLPALWAEAGKKGKVENRKKLKTYDSNNEVIGWIQDEARRLGVLTEDKIAALIYEYVGQDLYRLSNELQKLTLLAGKGNAITVEHLRLTLSLSATAEPYQVADHASGKNVRRALDTLSLLYKNGSDDPSIPTTNSLMKAVERLLVARSLLDRGASEDDVAARLAMNVWRCKSYFLPQVRLHTAGALKEAMVRLCGVDMQMKTSAASRRTALELMVLSLAR